MWYKVAALTGQAIQLVCVASDVLPTVRRQVSFT